MDLLVLVGPPGSGKGTVARLIVQRYGGEHLSTGDWIRERMRDPDSHFGALAKPYMDRGNYLPDDLAMQMFFSILDERAAGEERAESLMILDGFPRSVYQAEHFLDWLDEQKVHRLLSGVFLEIDEETTIERMSLRQSCPDCGATSHLLMRPMRVEGVCDLCGGRMERRADDAPDLIRQRMQAYSTYARPLQAVFADRARSISLDASATPEHLLSQIEQRSFCA